MSNQIIPDGANRDVALMALAMEFVLRDVRTLNTDEQLKLFRQVYAHVYDTVVNRKKAEGEGE